MTNADEPAVLALNGMSGLDPLAPHRLDWLRLIAAHAAVIEIGETVVGFVLTFTPGSSHDRLAFQWFSDAYGDRFLFVDRIAVAEEYRRQGIATKVYRALERAAQPFDRLVAEVVADPPAEPALAFHAATGFTEVGKESQPDGRTTVLLSKDLT